MPGTNAGTGQPLSFRCAKCKVRNSHWVAGVKRLGCNYEATGRTKAWHGPGSRGVRMVGFYIEYQCLDCKHKGWSRHPDMQRELLKLPHAEDCAMCTKKLLTGDESDCDCFLASARTTERSGRRDGE